MSYESFLDLRRNNVNEKWQNQEMAIRLNLHHVWIQIELNLDRWSQEPVTRFRCSLNLIRNEVCFTIQNVFASVLRCTHEMDINISIPDIRSDGYTEENAYTSLIRTKIRYSHKTKFRIEKNWFFCRSFIELFYFDIPICWYHSLFLIVWINCPALLVFIK